MANNERINPKSEDIITSGQDTTHCTEIPSIDPLGLTGYTFVHDHDDTKQHYEVNWLMEDQGNFVVEYAHGGEELMNYTELINTFNSRNYDG